MPWLGTLFLLTQLKITLLLIQLQHTIDSDWVNWDPKQDVALALYSGFGSLNLWIEFYLCLLRQQVLSFQQPSTKQHKLLKAGAYGLPQYCQWYVVDAQWIFVGWMNEWMCPITFSSVGFCPSFKLLRLLEILNPSSAVEGSLQTAYCLHQGSANDSHRPHQATTFFCTAHVLRMAFTFLDGCGRGVGNPNKKNISWQVKIIQNSHFSI